MLIIKLERQPIMSIKMLNYFANELSRELEVYCFLHNESMPEGYYAIAIEDVKAIGGCKNITVQRQIEELYSICMDMLAGIKLYKNKQDLLAAPL